jgi:dCMP deaminase
MRNPEQLWYDIVRRFAKQSKCQSRAVGAILVKDDSMIAEGWNSAPCGSSTEQCPRGKCAGKEASGTNLEQAICTHAEANAIANCAKRGVSTDNAIIYTTCFPCAECAKLIVSAGIKEVIYDKAYPTDLSYIIFNQASINYRSFKGITREE